MRKLIFFSLFITLFFFGCKKNVVFEKYHKFSTTIWQPKDTVIFQLPAPDTGFYNIYFNIRHTTNYPYKNLWLFVHIEAPNGQVEVDTVNIFLADDKGRWLGEGLGDLWDYKYLFRENVGFIKGGNYTFKLVQGMRDEKIPMVEVGLIIEKYKGNGQK